jgi:hypothetical protein
VANANPNMLNLNIPVNTPFYLEGAASDPDSDPWTANWVDYNSDPNNSVIPDNAGTSTTAPLFRWFEPSTDVIRYFPQLSSILDGNNTTGTGEVLPSVGRDMDFRFVVRDNAMDYGGLACDELTVMVDGNSGPFEITSQNTGAVWQSGDTKTITWSVNGTDQGTISATHVDILFSSDGGQSFSVTLAQDVPNDGMHDISVPTINTSEGRIKVQPSGNYIFFDINDDDIIISDDCLADGESIFPSTLLQAEEGDPELMLDMDYGTIFVTIADNIVAGDPNYDLVSEDVNTSDCVSQSVTQNYKIYEFKATTNGIYTFTESQASNRIMNLFSPDFTPVSPCNNWLASSSISESTSQGRLYTFFNNVSTSLTAFDQYELTINDFNGNTPSFTISASGPGDVYFPGSQLAGFSYEYVVVNDASGNIELISAAPDLTSYAPGNYTVYGLSYDDSEDVQSYVGGSFTALEDATLNGTICADLSANSRAIEIQQVLPLDFLHFTVDRVKAGAHLQWSIADAEDVSHFEVERFDDKRGEFVYIAEQAYQEGTTTYEDIDPDIQSGQRYLYRIRSVDMDGFTRLSPIRWIQTPHDEDFTVFPNPTRDFFRIQGPVEDIQEVRIYDRVGRTVLHEQGPSDNRISTQNWTAGLYQVEIFTAERSLRLSLLVQ